MAAGIHYLYASLTTLNTLHIPTSLRPATDLHLGPGVWGAAGGVYRRVDGDLLAWMAQTLNRQADAGDADPDAHARSVGFLQELTTESANRGIQPSPAPPEGYRIRTSPPHYRSSFLTQ